MPDYDVRYQATEVNLGSTFQQIDRSLSIQIGADCTDPLDHTEFVTPAATPMAPCFTGSDHDHGIWMPIRRTRVNVVATDPVTRFIVDDAEPFKVGDTVHAIDVSGPNAGCTDLGAITLIDYNTNTITVTNNASGLNVDDWIEVTENGCVDVDSDRFKHPRLVGMLKAAHDTRLTAGDTTGTTLAAASTLEADVRPMGGNREGAAKVGELVAERAKAAGVNAVVFDRGGLKYHGRVAAVAEAARAAGLEF